ncbi:MAG: hypothetical protein ABIH69_01290 [bacterium]
MNERDYTNNIVEINNIEEGHASVSYLTNVFSNNFPQNNQPSSSIYDLEKKGARDGYQVDCVYPATSALNIGLSYGLTTRDLRSSYIDSAGEVQTLDRNGRFEERTVIVGYQLTDWFDLTVAYDDTAQFDSYGGSEVSREGVVGEEGTHFGGLSYGLRLHNENFWFGLSLGDYHDVGISYEAGSSPGTYNTSGLARISLILGGKMFDGKLILNYGGYTKRIALVSQFNGGLGAQIIPVRDFILALGLKVKAESDQHGTYTDLSTNIGGEVPLSVLEGLKLRGGVVSRTRENSLDYFNRFSESGLWDYTLGFGYERDRLKLDFLYYSYQGVFGSSYNWLTTSTLLENWYVYTPTNERNAIYAVSMGYEI